MKDLQEKELTKIMTTQENYKKLDDMFDNLNYKISYHSKWDDEGTHYTRIVLIKCTQEQLDELNYLLWDSPFLMGSQYDKEDYKLHFGENFTKLTISKTFDVLAGLSLRVSGQHNTLFTIEKIN